MSPLLPFSNEVKLGGWKTNRDETMIDGNPSISHRLFRSPQPPESWHIESNYSSQEAPTRIIDRDPPDCARMRISQRLLTVTPKLLHRCRREWPFGWFSDQVHSVWRDPGEMSTDSHDCRLIHSKWKRISLKLSIGLRFLTRWAPSWSEWTLGQCPLSEWSHSKLEDDHPD